MARLCNRHHHGMRHHCRSCDPSPLAQGQVQVSANGVVTLPLLMEGGGWNGRLRFYGSYSLEAAGALTREQYDELVAQVNAFSQKEGPNLSRYRAGMCIPIVGIPFIIALNSKLRDFIRKLEEHCALITKQYSHMGVNLRVIGDHARRMRVDIEVMPPAARASAPPPMVAVGVPTAYK